MKLYVPEIGDVIKLTEDWKFKLHAEPRNQALGAMFGYFMNYSKWIDSSKVEQIRNIDYEVQYPEFDHNWDNYTKYQNSCREAEENCPEYVKYWEDHAVFVKKCREVEQEEIDVTIPAGAELKIDRIYIRKGAHEYSSITFFVTGLGSVIYSPSIFSTKKPTKKSSLRFWAKLADCNNIHFEKVIEDGTGHGSKKKK